MHQLTASILAAAERGMGWVLRHLLRSRRQRRALSPFLLRSRFHLRRSCPSCHERRRNAMLCMCTDKHNVLRPAKSIVRAVHDALGLAAGWLMVRHFNNHYLESNERSRILGFLISDTSGRSF